VIAPCFDSAAVALCAGSTFGHCCKRAPGRGTRAVALITLVMAAAVVWAGEEQRSYQADFASAASATAGHRGALIATAANLDVGSELISLKDCRRDLLDPGHVADDAPVWADVLFSNTLAQAVDAEPAQDLFIGFRTATIAGAQIPDRI
jgi:hypothetical protein